MGLLRLPSLKKKSYRLRPPNFATFPRKCLGTQLSWVDVNTLLPWQPTLTAKFLKICIFHTEDLFSWGDSLHKTSLMNDINFKTRPRNSEIILLPSIIANFSVCSIVLLGRDPFNQSFRKFRSKTQWIGSVQPEKFRKNRSTFWGGPLFPVGPVWMLVEWIAPLVSRGSRCFC